MLADGAPALIWADRFERRRYRLRLAAEGATHEESAPPAVRIQAPAKSTLKGDRAVLRVPVKCSGPCELRGDLDGIVSASTSLALDRGGKGTLTFRAMIDAKYRNRRGRVRLRVTSAAVGGTRTRRQTRSFAVVRTGLHATPPTRVTGLRVLRRGSTIRVTFKMSSRSAAA